MSKETSRLAKNLRTLRKRNKLSQTKAAKILGLDQSALSRVESGKQEISIDVLCRMRKLFKETADNLLDGTYAEKLKEQGK